MEKVDCVVVGAGVVGLAVARELALAGREVVTLEAESAIGTHTSSRNSEVIHAGIYYPKDSLKARTCVAGNALLYRYCEAHGVPHRRCGKLIVAADEAQLEALRAIGHQARANGVPGMSWLDSAEARAMEPLLHCTAALHSTTTGIVDSHALMLAYLGDAQGAGAVLALRSPMDEARVVDEGIELQVGGTSAMRLRANVMINSAGLAAPQVARRIAGYPACAAPRGWLAKGSYFRLRGRSPFHRLVYPIPEPGGLGVHLTLDLAGQARFGPDVEWVERVDYSVDPLRAEQFYGSIRRYFPALPEGALEPAYAGIRPKVSGPGEPAADFILQGPAEHGVRGLVHLFGIESPGLTASLALAREVRSRLAL